MAGVAGAERQAYIFRPAIGARQMAFLARHLLMHAGERITGPAVIEGAQRPGRHLPIIKPMALLAILPQSALVPITMAGYTPIRYSKVSAVEVLDRNGGALCRRNVGRGVTARAGQARVLAFQRVAGFAVIERAWSWIPADKLEVLPVVL